MPKNTLERLNLLPQDPFFETTVGRLLSWATTVGRYLVILTEMLIVLTIGAKFKLDRDLTDLNSAINMRSATVSSYGDLETTVRSAQARLEFIRKQQAQPKVETALTVVKKNLPRDLNLDSIEVQGQGITISGRAYTLASLTGITTSLRNEPKVQKLFLEDIRQNKEGLSGYDFRIRMELKP